VSDYYFSFPGSVEKQALGGGVEYLLQNVLPHAEKF
jgi:hypothetical protein